MKNIQRLDAKELLAEYEKLGNNTRNDVAIRKRFLELMPRMKPEDKKEFAKYDEFAFALAIDVIFKNAPSDQKQVGEVINAVWSHMERNYGFVSVSMEEDLSEAIGKVVGANFSNVREAHNSVKKLYSGEGCIPSQINDIISSGMKERGWQKFAESAGKFFDNVGKFFDSIKTLLGMEVEKRTSFTISPSVVENVRKSLDYTKYSDSLKTRAGDLRDTVKDPWRDRVTQNTGKGGYER